MLTLLFSDFKSAFSFCKCLLNLSSFILQRYENFSNFTSFLQTIIRLKMLIFNNLHSNNLYRLPQIKSPYLLIFKQRDEICPADGISLLFYVKTRCKELVLPI